MVAVEQRTWLPFDPGPLATLPYPIEAGRPLLLLDTETTGLGSGTGTLVFLVGMASGGTGSCCGSPSCGCRTTRTRARSWMRWRRWCRRTPGS